MQWAGTQCQSGRRRTVFHVVNLTRTRRHFIAKNDVIGSCLLVTGINSSYTKTCNDRGYADFGESTPLSRLLSAFGELTRHGTSHSPVSSVSICSRGRV